MHFFRYRNGHLYCEDVDLARVAEELDTPTFVYSAGTILDHYTRLDGALAPLDHLICYAVKANTNRWREERARPDCVTGEPGRRSSHARVHLYRLARKQVWNRAHRCAGDLRASRQNAQRRDYRRPDAHWLADYSGRAVRECDQESGASRARAEIKIPNQVLQHWWWYGNRLPVRTREWIRQM